MSIGDSLTCGLASVVTYKYLTANHTKTKNPVCKKNAKGKILQEKFENCFNISYTTLRNRYPTIIQMYGIEKQKKSRNKESFVRSLFSKKVDFAI